MSGLIGEPMSRRIGRGIVAHWAALFSTINDIIHRPPKSVCTVDAEFLIGICFGVPALGAGARVM
jgi:hypothetical protein